MDLVDGAICVSAGATGYCDRGVCVPSGCGNAIIDPGESCDDGNNTGGDGCSAGCEKLEVCGDGVLDGGEGCDDGNTNPADGCDACVATTWLASAMIGGTTNATMVGLAAPEGVAADLDGNIYVADTDNHRVRRIDKSGVITSVAGTGQSGYSGDGDAATNAQLASPSGVAVDGLGNLYIADWNNNRIRRVDATGIITTIAGNGLAGFSGDGGAATNAQLNQPRGVAVDGLGTVYVADASNHRVRRIDKAGLITTLAGTGTYGVSGNGGPAISAQINFPLGVAADSSGNVYVADTFNNRIRRIDATGVITTVAGSSLGGFSGDGGPATNARLNYPASVALDGQGNLVLADRINHRIRRIDGTGIITTIAGTGAVGFSGDGGAATDATLQAPYGVAMDGLGNVIIADTNTNRVRRIDTSGVITTAAGTGSSGSGDGGAATSAPLSAPEGVAVDVNGNVYFADAGKDRIRKVDATGVISTVAGTGTAGFSGDGGPASSAQLFGPMGLAVDGLGVLTIADTNNHRIRQIDANGVITTLAGTGNDGATGDGGPAISAELGSPSAIARDGAGNIYFADPGQHRVRRIDATGVITAVAGVGTSGYSGDGADATYAELASPAGVAVSGLGNVIVADTENSCVRQIDVTNVITTIAGIGNAAYSGDGGDATIAELAYPNAVAVAAGDVYIADNYNQRIRRIDATGVITTIAGTDNEGFSGDGGMATNAELAYPHGLTVDGAGNVYLAGSGRVRRIDATGVITTIAGAIDPEGMGPLAQARLADPRALILAPTFTLFAGGSSGTVQASRNATWLEVVAGRYPQPTATGALARFRDETFGTVSGIAFDASAGLIFMTESTTNRIHVVTIVDPADENTWTIAPLANATGTAGFADGAAATAQFRTPTGLYLAPETQQLYVADTGNHLIRAIDLSSGTASATVRTVAGTPATRGFFGDGAPAADALLYEPRAITMCGNGDVFVADTGNHRVRRIDATTGTISTVLGAGVAASSGDGAPASTFPVNAPLGLACDLTGNLYATSTTTVRLVAADAGGVVDGSGTVQTIYGAAPRDRFPASVTTCLTGLAIVDATSLVVTDSCTGMLVELRRVLL